MKQLARRILKRLRPWRPDPLQPDMARDWEYRAQQNAMHYIADFREKWDDIDEFFGTGEHDLAKLLEIIKWTPEEMKRGRILEIGCGVGRMTRHLATRFDEVVGIDISPTMIERGKELNASIPNARFQVNSGSDLSDFEDDSFDYILSYIVFQHIPSEDIIAGYIREGIRVLKPGGSFFFQARNLPAGPVVDTYSGAPIEVERVKRIASEAGREARLLVGEGTLYCFFEIR